VSSAKKSRTSAPQNLSITEALAKAHAHWNAGQAAQAELLCQRILAVWPGQADALHLLGLMAHAYGHLDLAISHLREACKAPRAPAVYASNLAEMCRQKGLLVEGEAAARRAVAMDSMLPGAWNNLGILLQEAGKFEESRLCLERVLTLQPQNAEAHNNLGNTCKRLGLLAQAESCWSRALALKPNYAEPHSNLANLLSDQGELTRAAEHARRAIDLNPQFADAYINLAAVETARQRHAEALRCLDALLTFAPLHATGLAARALALKQLDRPEAALDTVRRAIAAAPNLAQAHNAHGQVLQALGQFDAALAAYDRAAGLPGTAAEQALINRAILFMEHGQAAQAEAAFAHAVEMFPRSASAWFNRADLKSFTPDDPAIAAMQALLGPDGVQARNDQMLLHFALGKAFLDLGQSDRAFAHLDAGNQMKRASLTYDADTTSQWMASIAAAFTPDVLERLGHLRSEQNTTAPRPIFVLGMPRSGTTLVEQILASHPDIHGAGELNHIPRLVGELGAFPAAVAGITLAQLSQLGDAYLAAIAPLAQGQRHVVDKMPANFLYAGLIRLILPEARIIHCRRDPVDTCLSCYSKLFAQEQVFSYDLAELGRFHRDYQRLTAHWRAALPAAHFLEVDYEAVVDDLEREARRMLAFLDIPWDPACLAFYETRRPVRTASVNQVRKPVYRSATGRWRAHAAHLGPLLEALAIAPEQPRHKTASPRKSRSRALKSAE
jgi:tetratricopeptide (TPR) repeat protein